MRESVRQSSKRLNAARPHRRRPAGQTELYLAQYEAEQRFRAIFDKTSDGIFLHDLETRKLTMGNKSCLQMLGHTEEEFLKLTVADLHPEADLPLINAQIEKFLQGGTANRHDIRFKRKDGSIVFADVSLDLVLLDGKRYVVVDRGRGFDAQGLQGATGFGLLSIHERVQLLGGQMKIRSMRGVGARVLIVVPDEAPSQVTAPTEPRDG